MGEDDKLPVYQAIQAMFETHSKPRPSPAALKLYWDALAHARREDFDRAMARAASELKWPARPAELREFCREAKRGELPGPVQYRCHFHGDGEYHHPKVGRPNEPSTSPTCWWCDRCDYFVSTGQQQPDPPRQIPSFGDTVRAIAKAQERE
jgi:hypothetical protein